MFQLAKYLFQRDPIFQKLLMKCSFSRHKIFVINLTVLLEYIHLHATFISDSDCSIRVY